MEEISFLPHSGREGPILAPLWHAISRELAPGAPSSALSPPVTRCCLVVGSLSLSEELCYKGRDPGAGDMEELGRG